MANLPTLRCIVSCTSLTGGKGLSVGFGVGFGVGFSVGRDVGLGVGFSVGRDVGLGVFLVGIGLGAAVGSSQSSSKSYEYEKEYAESSSSSCCHSSSSQIHVQRSPPWYASQRSCVWRKPSNHWCWHSPEGSMQQGLSLPGVGLAVGLRGSSSMGVGLAVGLRGSSSSQIHSQSPSWKASHLSCVCSWPFHHMCSHSPDRSTQQGLSLPAVGLRVSTGGSSADSWTHSMKWTASTMPAPSLP